jgi:hypothetical protein
LYSVILPNINNNKRKNLTIVTLLSKTFGVKNVTLNGFTWSRDEDAANAVYHKKTFSVPVTRSPWRKGVFDTDGMMRFTPFRTRNTI